MTTIITGLTTSALTALIGYCTKRAISAHKKQTQVNEALTLGIQSLLRARIINEYEYWSKKGYIPLYAADSLEACYQSYEGLGANGVIDEIIKKLKALPNNPPNKEGE